MEPELKEGNSKSSNQTYQKIKLIGEGSYGKVFLIKSLQTEKEYALKETVITKNKEIFLYFSMNEINILSKLDNPYIISLKCAFKTQINEQTEKLNIIMEYVDNGDLNQLITEYKDDEKIFPEARLNIFLMQDDTIKLGDFGISKKVTISNEEKVYVGTPIYTSPEIIQKKNYSYKTDIWSLGVTFIQLISLRLPFVADDNEDIKNYILNKKFNEKILNKDKNDFSDKIKKNYSKEFLELINQMVSINPDDRPSVKDILNNNMIKQRMHSYLLENNFDEKEIVNTISDLDKKINEIYNKINNDKTISKNEKQKNINEIKILIKKKELFKKMIIINESFKTEFKTIENK